MEMDVRQEQLSFTFLLLFLVIRCNCLYSDPEPKVQIGSWTLTLIDSDENHPNSTNYQRSTISPSYLEEEFFPKEYEPKYNSSSQHISSSQLFDSSVAASTPRRYITSSQSRRIVRVKKHKNSRRKSTRSAYEPKYKSRRPRSHQKLVKSESRHRNDAHRRHSHRSHRHRLHTSPHNHRSTPSHHYEDDEHYGYPPHRHYHHNHRDRPQVSDRFNRESFSSSPPPSSPLSTEGSSIVTDSDYTDEEIINPEGEPLSGDVITNEPPIDDTTGSYPVVSPDEYRTIEGYPPIDHQQYHPDYHHHAPNPEDEYPTPWSPSTHFRCEEVEFPGYYADIEAGCQVWHICEPDGRHHRISCPRETLFNQKHKVCDWWYNVECERSTEYYYLNRDMFGGQPFYGHEYRNGPTRYPNQEEVVWGRHESNYGSPRRSVISLNSNGMDAYEYPLNTEGESSMDYAASTKRTSRNESYQSSMTSSKLKKGTMISHHPDTAHRKSERQSSRRSFKSSKQPESRNFD